MPAIVFPARFDLPAIITPRMVRSYCCSIPSRRVMPAARGKSERDKKVNVSHLARKRSHFSCWENRSRARGTYAAKIRMKGRAATRPQLHALPEPEKAKQSVWFSR